MLADPNKEIRSQTFAVLQEFLREVRDADSIAYAPIVHVLVQHSSSQVPPVHRLRSITSAAPCSSLRLFSRCLLACSQPRFLASS